MVRAGRDWRRNHDDSPDRKQRSFSFGCSRIRRWRCRARQAFAAYSRTRRADFIGAFADRLSQKCEKHEGGSIKHDVSVAGGRTFPTSSKGRAAKWWRAIPQARARCPSAIWATAISILTFQPVGRGQVGFSGALARGERDRSWRRREIRWLYFRRTRRRQAQTRPVDRGQRSGGA